LVKLKITKENIFLIDACGALVSVVFLGIIYFLEQYFGMPKNILMIKICLAASFCVYSATNYFASPVKWPIYLKIIALLNVGYCAFAIYQMYQNSASLSLYGYAYFISEICIVIALAMYELKMANSNKTAS
jgi:hypothetical protein